MEVSSYLGLQLLLKISPFLFFFRQWKMKHFYDASPMFFLFKVFKGRDLSTAMLNYQRVVGSERVFQTSAPGFTWDTWQLLRELQPLAEEKEDAATRTTDFDRFWWPSFSGISQVEVFPRLEMEITKIGPEMERHLIFSGRFAGFK
jgi:hypothetical protein